MARSVLRTRSRQRGGTFTLIVLAATALIMITASVYVDTTRLGYERQALALQRSQVREAAFGGIRWAIADWEARGEERGQATIQLGGPVELRVLYEHDADPEALRVTATARSRGILQTLTARLEPREGEFELVGFSWD